MSVLQSLSEEQKNRAFRKATTMQLNEGKLVRVTEEYYKPVLEFMSEHYFSDEPVKKAAGAMWGEEARSNYERRLYQNISVMIVNEESGEILALLVNQVVKKGEMHEIGILKDEGLRTAWQLFNSCEKKANLFEHFNVDEAVQFASLMTNRKYRHRGLATKVVQASLSMIRDFGVGKICVKGEASSLFSQKILEKEGMICLYKGVYGEHRENDRKVSDGTGVHKSLNIYGMMLEQRL